MARFGRIQDVLNYVLSRSQLFKEGKKINGHVSMHAQYSVWARAKFKDGPLP